MCVVSHRKKNNRDLFSFWKGSIVYLVMRFGFHAEHYCFVIVLLYSVIISFSVNIICDIVHTNQIDRRIVKLEQRSTLKGRERDEKEKDSSQVLSTEY